MPNSRASIAKLTRERGFVLAAALAVLGAAMSWGAASIRVPQELAGVRTWFLLACMVAWVTGIRFAASRMEPSDMHRSLAVGAGFQAAVMFAAGRMGLMEPLVKEAAPFVLFWLVTSVVATAVVHFQELSAEAGRAAPQIARFWLPIVIGFAIACLALAVVLSLASGPLVRTMRGPAAFLLRIVGFALTSLGTVLVYVLYGIVWLFMRIIVRRDDPFIPPEAPVLDKPLEEIEVVQYSAPVLATLRWIGFAALALAAAWVIGYYLLRRWWRPAHEAPEEYRESYASLAVLRGWTSRRWRNLARRLRRPVLGPGSRPPHSAIGAYHWLLARAAGQGVARPREVTAHSFQPDLVECFPGRERAADRILDGFALEYYGGLGAGAAWPLVQGQWLSIRGILGAREIPRKGP